MTALRARLDVILVVDKEGKAIQHEFFTTLRDQLELTKRYPKIADTPAEAPIKLVFIAAQRAGVVIDGISFDEFVDQVLDLQIEEAPPLSKG